MMADPVEIMADLEHQQWAHWTRYMLDNLTPENIERWKQQCATDYADLNEKEKESDRRWARKGYAGVEAAGFRIAGPEPTEDILAYLKGRARSRSAMHRHWKAMHAKLPQYGSK